MAYSIQESFWIELGEWTSRPFIANPTEYLLKSGGLSTTLHPPMSRNEADTRAKLIDPTIVSRGWTEKDHIKREETAA